MAGTEQYDAIIIGSGQGGGPLSTALVAAGKKTALIEREHIGGTCINEGCTPTKTMIASARVAYLDRRSKEYGIDTGPEKVDLTVVRRRKRDIVTSFRKGSTERVKEGGVDILMGAARFTGPHDLEVTCNDGAVRTLSAPWIVIDTGTRPSVPPLEGLDSAPYLNSTSVMELGEVPDHLIVLGGGYVGLEFSQMFRRFGSKVTIVQLLPKLMGREDDDVADAVAEILRQDGIEVLLEAKAKSVSGEPGGNLSLTVETSDGERTIQGSHLLVAVGRAPNTGDLDLESAGIECDRRGFVSVNGKLETNVPGVYAIGDVNGGPQFTHISYDDFRILRDNLLHGGQRSTEGRPIPYAMFTDPELGRVGLSESEARKQGKHIRVAKMPMSHVARAIETDEQRGLMKVVVDAGTDQILGCAILGISGGELMAMVEIAMMGKLPYTALQQGIFAHPTLAEAFNNLFQSWTD